MAVCKNVHSEISVVRACACVFEKCSNQVEFPGSGPGARVISDINGFSHSVHYDNVARGGGSLGAGCALGEGNFKGHRRGAGIFTVALARLHDCALHFRETQSAQMAML